MKNFYPKSKGKKIHPSPSSSVAGDAMAVLKLLPATILVLTSTLRDEDKEVLAYLVTRAMNGGAAAPAIGIDDGKRPCARKGTAALDCGCFDCYTKFWSRWDASPDRDLIHHAIDAFEEHLARSERDSGRGRRREKGKKGKDKAAAAPPTPPSPARAEESPEPAATTAVDLEPLGGESAVAVAEEVAAVDLGAPASGGFGGSGERRRGWADVMGIFNSRLWGLWSPTV